MCCFLDAGLDIQHRPDARDIPVPPNFLAQGAEPAWSGAGSSTGGPGLLLRGGGALLCWQLAEHYCQRLAVQLV